MTDLTQARIDLVMLELQRRRMAGEIGADEPVGPEAMARISGDLGIPVSESTFRAVCRAACRKLHAHPEAPSLLAALRALRSCQ